MNVVAVIQARMGSSRLPGKVLAELAGHTMLARVVRRTRRARLVDRTVVATSTARSDDPVARQSALLETDCFRGSEDDVLDRYYHAACAQEADVVVRITADCPLVDPEVIDRVIRAFLRNRPDYASNTLQRTWPRGLDTEVFSRTALAQAWREADQPYQRVHVTPYLYGHPERFRLLPVTGPHDLGSWRWTVDHPEDLALIRAIYDGLVRGRGGRPGQAVRRMIGAGSPASRVTVLDTADCPDREDGFSWQAVHRFLLDRPWLQELNRHVAQKAMAEG